MDSCRPILLLTALLVHCICPNAQLLISSNEWVPVSTRTPEPTPSAIVYHAQPSFTSTIVGTTVAVVPTPVLLPVVEVNITTYGNNSCDHYTSGGPCEPVLDIFPFVVTNWSRSNQLTARYANDRIIETLDTFKSTQECINLATPLLCRYSFPTCDPAYEMPTYQPICRRDCLAAQHFVCREPWLQMEELIRVLELTVIDQPNCVPLENPIGGETPMCISTVDIFKGEIPLPLLSGSDCYSGHGRGYDGTVSVTQGGISCQSWNVSYPHQHLLDFEELPELKGGHNYCRNPAERGERPWCFTTDRHTRWDYCDIPECPGPACENYQGEVCFNRGMIGYDKVYINKTSLGKINQTDYEAEMQELLLTFDKYTEQCRESFHDFLCATNFASCDLSKTMPTPIRPCRHFCELVHEACVEEITRLKSFLKVINYEPVEIVFNCSILPNTVAGDLPQCFMPIMRQQKEGNTTCYNVEDKGFSYIGTVSMTVSGKTCQQWGSQFPHPHTLTPSSRIYLSGHNYCRNPEKRGEMPWCYTTDTDTRWEYCNVPACTVPSGPLSLNTIVTIAIVVPLAAAVAIVALLVVVCVVWFCCQRNKSSFELRETTSHHYVQNVQLAGKDVSDVGPLYAKNPLAIGEASLEYDGVKLPEISRETIVYTRDLGQGHFGVVVQAEAECIGAEMKPQTVAVKVLKVGATPQVKKEFFREAALMNAFDHPNILKLFGVCIEQEPLCMVFEYMENGDLNEFLRQNAPKPPFPGLTNEQLVEFCVEISAGLEYLAQNHYVHRDMATRNCLVSSSYRVKISDFGLSQDVYSSDYFTLGDAEMLPIRWMPPEAILHSKFTTQSDVWSFGVVLWEIFSFGIQPYYTMSNEAVVQHVRDGNVMSCPGNCLPEIYDLMIDCWVMNPAERPTASELHNGLRRWSPNFAAKLQEEEYKSKSEYQNMAVVREYAQQGLPTTTDTNGEPGSAYDHLHALHKGTGPPGESCL